jgi:hypothetical protein
MSAGWAHGWGVYWPILRIPQPSGHSFFHISKAIAMKMFKLFILAGFLLFGASSCDFLNYDEMQDEKTMSGGNEKPPCQGDCD